MERRRSDTTEPYVARGMKRRLVRLAMTVLAGMALVVAAAGPAAAHADLVEASPSPGSGVPQAPAAVVMRFTEPLNYRLSSLSVADEDGEEVTDGPTEPVEGDRHAMRRKLGLLQPGVYTVRWTTVSPLDGHTLKGSYRFGIGTAASGNEEVRADPLSSEGLGGLVGRSAAFAGLALWAGGVIAGPWLGSALPARRRRSLAVAGPLLAALGTLGAAMSSAVVSTGSGGTVGDVLLSSASGRYRMAVIVLGSVAAVWRPRRRGVALGLVVPAAVADAAAGHAATATIPVLATGVFAAHLSAVGVWVYAIAAAAVAGAHLVTVLRRLSPYAVVAASAVGLTGVAAAMLALNRPGELFSTGYGQTITVKSALFALMAILGIGHWVGTRRGVATKWLRVPVAGEALGATLAVAVAAVLVGFPDPPRQAEAAAHRADTSTSIEALEDAEAMSVAEASGPFVVALTILPPRPGAVVVQLNVVGLDPGDALRDGQVRASAPDGTRVDIDLDDCGLGCLHGRARLADAGPWNFAASATTNRAPITAEFRIPLPAPDATSALERALEATEQLRTARMHETLRGEVDAEGLATDYQFAAPDAMRYDVRGGGSIIFRGTTRYRRPGGAESWSVGERSPPGFTWPEDYYRDFWAPTAAARVLGREVLDGTETEVLAFLRPDIAAWFRIWVGVDDGIVRRIEMRAEGHLMDQSYNSFNEPLTIAPPS